MAALALFAVASASPANIAGLLKTDDAPPPPTLNNPCLSSSVGPWKHQPWCDPTLPLADRVADMLSRLTLDEKIGNLGTDATPMFSLGLVAYQWWSESSHGVASGRHGASRPTTNFAYPITTAMAFNRSLWLATGAAIGTEARALMNTGDASSTFWAPVINLARDPRWGRNLETPGEDPYLTGEYSIYYVQGMQESPSDPGHIMASACCKHYVANSMEDTTVAGERHQRYDFDAQVTPQDLIDSYMRPFQACVEEGRVSGLMCSYNSVNGVPTCADPWLLTTVARGEWRFDGYVTSDCDADAVVYVNHKYKNQSKAEDVRDVLRAGTDVDCGGFVSSNAQAALDASLISEADIDERLAFLLRVRMRLGHFDPPGPLQSLAPDKEVCTEATQRLAADGVTQSAALLKNTRATLPLRAGASVAMLGPVANLSRSMASYYGPGHPCGGLFPTLYDAVVANAGGGAVSSAMGVPSVDWDAPSDGVAAAAALAAGADSVIVAIGNDLSWAREAMDAHPLHGTSVPPAQLKLVSAAAAAATSPITVIVFTASPLDISTILANPNVGAVMHVGFPAVAAIGLGPVLYGARSPAGRLVQTIYAREFAEQVSIFDMNMRPGPSAFPAPNCTLPHDQCPKTTNPGRTHRFYTGKPVLPFGFGLSYSKFKYSFARAPARALSLGPLRQLLAHHAAAGHTFLRKGARSSLALSHNSPGLTIHDGAGALLTNGADAIPTDAAATSFFVAVTNTGEVDADDVVLGFLHPPGAGVDGVPLQTLFGFERVHVPAGQTVIVTLYPSLSDFALVTPGGGRAAHPGEYTVRFGLRETAELGMGHVEHKLVAY